MCQTHQLDEQDALDEEKEAIRLQKKHAEDLNEEDFALGASAPKGGSAPAATQPGLKPTPSLDVEHIQKSADLLTKDEKLKMVAEGTVVSSGGCTERLSGWLWMNRISGASHAATRLEKQGGRAAGAHHTRAETCAIRRPAN